MRLIPTLDRSSEGFTTHNVGSHSLDVISAGSSPACPEPWAPLRRPCLARNARLDPGLVGGGEACGGPQGVHAVRALPREVVVLATELAGCGRLLEDGPVPV